MVVRDESHPDPPGDVLFSDTLRQWGDDKPWQYTPPLIIGVEDEADIEAVHEEIKESVSTNRRHSVPNVSASGRHIFGYLVSCEDLGKLARIDGIDHVEIEGYGKTMSQ